MTADNGDFPAWLDCAISARERMAQESVEQATVNLAGADPSSVSVWHVIERPATGTFVAARDQWDRVAEVVPTYGGAHAEHIALNNPASVLRRCAADRKLLELHQGVPNHGRYSEQECPDDCDGQHIGPPVCMACRDYAGDPLEAPCATVLLIAEGYGWTPDKRQAWLTLSGHSRAESEKRTCGDAKRHPSHTFMRMEVLFQCPGTEVADNGTES